MSPQQVALVAAGALYLVVGVLAFLVPGTFSSELAAFPPQNDHFVRDLGTWNVGLGLAAPRGPLRQSWFALVLFAAGTVVLAALAAREGARPAAVEDVDH